MKLLTKLIPRNFNLDLAYFSFLALTICIFSGLILSFHYFPEKPLLSVVNLEATVPFGKFYRALHYFSAQMAVISLFLHLLDALRLKLFLVKSNRGWFFLGLSLPILLYLAFSGYILRGDETGELAGSIAENLTSSIPLLGKPISNLFFAISQVGVHRVYLWHLYFSFLLLTGLLLWHISLNRVFSYLKFFYLALLFLPALFFYPSLKPWGNLQARGPWFFVGAQSMLKFLDERFVFFYLLLFPFIYQAFVIWKKNPTPLFWILIAYLGLYLIFSLMGI